MEVKKTMDLRKLMAISALVLMCSFAFAAAPTVVVLNEDDNYYYPSRGATIPVTFTVVDSDNPGDANVHISYYTCDNGGVCTGQTYMTNLSPGTDCVGNDCNIMNFCTSGNLAVAQTCSYTWTPPTGADSNYLIDVNVFDTVTSDAADDNSGSIYADFNACTTVHSVTDNRTVTLNRLCTGYGMDENGGAEITYYGSVRDKRCPDSIRTEYSAPFTKTFGEFTNR